jgi:uncharacterized membrane protein (UPF0127 family)
LIVMARSGAGDAQVTPPAVSDDLRGRMAPIAVIAIAIMFGYWSYQEHESAQWANLSTPRGSVRVLVANNASDRSQGLSRRIDLPQDGLLLRWNAAGRHPIWMAEMRFPLDLIWLRDDGRVTGVLANVPVCSSPQCALYEPAGTHETVAVLELASGAAANHGIEIGTVIRRLPPSSNTR